MHMACGQGETDLVRQLIDAGARREVKGAFGTPLKMAMLEQHPDVVEVLREAHERLGPDPKRSDGQRNL